MISEYETRQVLDAALARGGDFAELFLEDREETNIQSRGGVLQGVKTIRIHGAGLTVLQGAQRVYVHTNRTDREALAQLACRAAGMLAAARASGAAQALRTAENPSPNPILLYPGEVQASAKIRAVDQAQRAARAAGPQILAMNVDYFDNDQRILVANSEGLLAPDRRVSTRMRFQVTLGDEHGSFFDWEDYTAARGFEALVGEGCEAFARDYVRRMERMWKAQPVRPCRVPVVLAAGGAGTLWHECCGHGLEASAAASGDSLYAGRLGTAIASPRVTLIDDGTFPGLYGSSAIDDEGHPRQKNVLIERGVLRQYLCDRLHGRLLGLESNGCGRRQNYTFPVTSRMSNTYLAPGEDDEEEMLRSVPGGLLVQSLGGGSGGATFTIAVKEGFWIRNGQIDRQVKGVVLSGSGLDVMARVDRVGRRLEPEMGAFCGADSGLVPTTAFQPRMRVTEMTIGGEERAL